MEVTYQWQLTLHLKYSPHCYVPMVTLNQWGFSLFGALGSTWGAEAPLTHSHVYQTEGWHLGRLRYTGSIMLLNMIPTNALPFCILQTQNLGYQDTLGPKAFSLLYGDTVDISRDSLQKYWPCPPAALPGPSETYSLRAFMANIDGFCQAFTLLIFQILVCV